MHFAPGDMKSEKQSGKKGPSLLKEELGITLKKLTHIYHKNRVFLILFQLLDCFSLPTVLVLSWLLLRSRYRLTHIGGLALALMSVVALVWADVEDGEGGVTAGGESISRF